MTVPATLAAAGTPPLAEWIGLGTLALLYLFGLGWAGRGAASRARGARRTRCEARAAKMGAEKWRMTKCGIATGLDSNDDGRALCHRWRGLRVDAR